MTDSTETQTDFDLGRAVEPIAPVVGVVQIFAEQGTLCTAQPIERTVVVGRDAAHSHLVVDDKKVSRAHLELSPAPGGLVARDLGSRNGTALDGVTIEGRAPAPVGALLRLGRSILLVVSDARAHRPIATNETGLIGGPKLDGARRIIQRVAGERLPLLITGETGTGKERVSQAIHATSGRRGPLVGVNCAALPRDLVESELFGHEHGAFSGSQQARTGLFRQAHQGTLLLDEIGELPLATQAKLLRVLEDGRVRPVGSDREVPVDVRVIGATNRDLAQMVTENRFRADLYHRIAAVRLALPPLRARREDVPPLAQAFLDAYLAESPSRGDLVGFSVVAMEALCLSSWPGNVRALRHVVQVAAVNARAAGRARIAPEDLTALAQDREPDPPPATAEASDAALRARIETALELCAGNVSHVGRRLGMSRSSLYEAMKRLAIDPSAFRR